MKSLVTRGHQAAIGCDICPTDGSNEPANSSDPYRVLLFLPCMYGGGVWHAVKDLVRALEAINRERRQLQITLGLAPAHFSQVADELGDEVTVCPVEVVTTKDQASDDFSAGAEESYFDFGELDALRAEVWVALADRFSAPLRRARPYGVFVYDMIQRHAPDGFTKAFFEMQAKGIGPTIVGADRVFVTSPVTMRDVHEEFGVPADKFSLVPVACEPNVRFDSLTTQSVDLPRTPYILQVSNTAPHKGIAESLRGYRRLKDRLGAACPPLVLCGYYTDRLSKHCKLPHPVPYWTMIQSLTAELKLREGTDVVFLGYVNDEQLKNLFERCAVVINAARHDNGSFSVIEARYYGKPTVSTDYPASRFLYERFKIPVHFVPLDDEDAMADGLQQALEEPQLTGKDLVAVREQLASPILGYRRYAESVYDALVELGIQGRAACGTLAAA